MANKICGTAFASLLLCISACAQAPAPEPAAAPTTPPATAFPSGTLVDLSHTFDKTAISSIEKAIQSSDLGITPNNDGNVIRLAFPPLTEERRKELVKQVHGRAEDDRVAVRNVRRHAKDVMEKLEHGGDISEDDLTRAEKDLQKMTDRFVSEIDQIQGHKEQELMEV